MRQRRFSPGAWLRLVPQAALTVCGIGALRFVEVLVSPPPQDAVPRWVVAAAAGSLYWLAGGLLGAVALIAWAVRRAFGSPAPPAKPPPPAPPPPTREMRLRGWGVNVVIGWLGLSFLTLLVMSDTRTGPFAWLAVNLFGLAGFAGLATFLLGLPVMLLPLAVLAVLPGQTRWPLLAGMQWVVKPVPRAKPRRRRR